MRSKKTYTRQIQPDKKHDSVLVARLINRSMRDGKKSVAAKQVYKALEIVSTKLKKKPVEALEEVLGKISPKMEVRTRRVGGASYQVPVPVKYHRANSLAIRWLVLESNKKPNKQYHSYAEKLGSEMLDILEEKGGTLEKRNTAHKMAEANKAFAHFRW